MIEVAGGIILAVLFFACLPVVCALFLALPPLLLLVFLVRKHQAEQGSQGRPSPPRELG